MMLIKTRVPNYTEKHVVCEIDSKPCILYADLTLLRDSSFQDDIPIYIANDVSDMVLHSFSTRYDLNEMGIY